MKRSAFCIVSLGVLCAPLGASAWNVRSPITEPCHERLTLGALGAAPGAWQRIAPEPGEALLSTWMLHAEAAGGVPRDRPTEYWMQQLVGQHELGQRPRLEQYVLASFVEGVRAPDVEGLHPSQLGALRGLHIGDHRQPSHALRRSNDAGGEAGDLSAIEATRRWILERVERASEQVSDRAPRNVRVSVPHYGEVVVRVLGAAYELGVAAHALQDAYTHTLRDDELRIVAVLNWVDAVTHGHDPREHGPAHSDRLDECNLASEFDVMRYTAAQRATLELFAGLSLAASSPRGGLDQNVGASILDKALSYRSGCDRHNDYCDSAWLPVAEQSTTGPYSWAGCQLTTRSEVGRHPHGPSWLPYGLFGGWLFWFGRRRSRQGPVNPRSPLHSGR